MNKCYLLRQVIFSVTDKMSTLIYLLISYFKHFSPSKSSKFLTTSPSPDESPKGGTVPKTSPKKGFLPKSRDEVSEKRQTLDKNIKQLFGARMASKGKEQRCY